MKQPYLVWLQAARAISSIADVAGEAVEAYAQLLLQDLLVELPGRLWEVS